MVANGIKLGYKQRELGTVRVYQKERAIFRGYIRRARTKYIHYIHRICNYITERQ